MNSEYHNPVLLNKCIEGLSVKKDGVYVDATFGGGGHSKKIIEILINGRLYAFDQDEDAWENTIDDDRFVLIKENFSHLKKALNDNGVEKVDGLLADLGVSSHQFDTAERGFSTRFDSELDMRMNRSVQITASDVLNTYQENELKKIFFEYGELRNALRISKAIVTARKKKKIKTVNELKNELKAFAMQGKENQFYAKVFQALRIEVNDELNALKELLMQSTRVIRSKGRLVVISYHSLEDRLVKNFMRSGNFEGGAEKDLYGNRSTPFLPLNNKPWVPSALEIGSNPRARSAKLRIAEKK
ncbi:MAG: 16S rRNA (cytosine(1402)-N(4))-methyltransferase RsmH [Bacteroidia bacterium]